jgi:thiol:disulfide interchange protein DsbD
LVEAASKGELHPSWDVRFSLALALPLLFAMFPGWLNSPKSGGWLNTVKVVLGFLNGFSL